MILITRPKEQSKNLETILGLKGYETYLDSLNKIDIKFDNIFLVGNNVFKVSNLNKSVFKYIDGKLISIIKYK